MNDLIFIFSALLLVGFLIWVIKIFTKDSFMEVSSSNEEVFILETEETITAAEAERRGKSNYYKGQMLTVYVGLDQEEKSRILGMKDLDNPERYSIEDLTDAQIEFLSSTNLLGSFDNWSYEDSKKAKIYSGYFIPASVTSGTDGHETRSVSTEKFLFWIKIENMNCHYYFRGKSKTEKLFDKFRRDDDIYLGNYECFTKHPSRFFEDVRTFLEPIETLNPLDFEILDDNLFVSFKIIDRPKVKMIESTLINLEK